jgi:Amt family ammonium transporter
MLGLVSGAVAGLVAVTPAAGWVGPLGAIVIGAAAGAVCFYFVAYARTKIGYDDSLDVFGIHCVGGIIGAIGTGIFVSQALGGVGIPDYESKPGELTVGAYNMASQVWVQTKGVLFTLIWSGIGSAIIFKIVDLIVGLRVAPDQEREGLDLAEHGERAYMQ